VSDVEKTLIDPVYFGEMREELAGEFGRRVDRKNWRGTSGGTGPPSGGGCWPSWNENHKREENEGGRL